MGAISIGLLRGNSTSRLHGTNLRIGPTTLVCFLYHCFGLSTNSPRDCATISRGCGIRREQGIRVCRGRTLRLALFWHGYCGENMENMEYPGNYRVSESSLPQLPAQLHACWGSAGRAACHRPSDSDSPFRLRPNYAVPSGLYGQPASARRATARRGRKLSALLAALLFGASGAAQATIINAASPSYADVSSAVASAVDGDTVIVPSGSATWTSQFVISKAITLIGATTTDSVAGTAVDATVITADMPGTTSIPLITINSTAGKSYRISGFTFQDAR